MTGAVDKAVQTAPLVPKRLCILMPSHWAANAGGAEYQVRSLIDAVLRSGGFEVHYVARNVDLSYSANGYCIHRVHAARSLAGTYVLDTLAVLRILWKIRPVVVYQRVAGAYTGAAAFFARRTGARMVWHVSSDRDLIPQEFPASWRWPLQRLNRRMIAYGASAADAVVVQSQNQRELLRRHFGRSDAIQISNFHAQCGQLCQKSDAPLLVCWVGNIKEIKSPETFVRLARDFRSRRDVRFLMAGGLQMKSAAWQQLKAEIDQLPNIEYLGVMPHEAVGELLAKSHVLVNTSAVEGFPNTFIEAWVRQVAVVSLSVNPDSAFDKNENGICAHGDYERMKSALTQLLEDRMLRESIGSRAAEYAQLRFGAGNLDRLVNVLRGCHDARRDGGTPEPDNAVRLRT